ncbi:glycosyltransferase family 4 protein [Desulfovibrio mangrovi]|uniref:glycosyltransferase family 4 protein n=1 Tax=Desulfovibrio mangrovi TaxID=2976983 RepID=UPI00224510B2|nr:glycosyltransferase family 4 protein [Desulfovibrio mangrovi]UZP68931.1 glycosyltransferase family 4 protein [Desulfovibrio mangrovi]
MTVNKIRVLHVVQGLGAGGTEKVMQLLACYTAPERFAVAVHSPADGPRAGLLRQAGIQTYVGGDVAAVLERLRPHIIHVHRGGWPEPVLMRPLRLYRQTMHRQGRKAVLVETNVFGRHDDSPGGAALDATFFVSRFCAHRYGQVEGIAVAPPRYQVLYNPVDTDFFAAHALPPEQRDYARPVIGRISRPDPGKWSALALEFLPATVRALPDMRYRIVGGIDEAHRYVAEQGLEDNVEFCAPVLTDGELVTFFDSISLLAHANDTGESFGLVIAEAMACGLPVVTHPAAGLRDNAQLELVEHGITGLVARSAEEYAEAVLHLLRHPDEARRMGMAGREKAQRLFRVQTVVRKLEQIYRELLERCGGVL